MPPAASSAAPADNTACQSTPDELTLRIPPRRVLWVAFCAIGCMVALGALLPSYVFWLGRESYTLAELARRVNLDGEGNIPSWFSALLLLACAITLFVLASASLRRRGRWRFHWLALAIVFLYLSLDEAAQLHELLNIPARLWLTDRMDGAIWVMPILAIGLLGGLAYIPFLLALPIKIAAFKVVAGIAFVTGAMGVETISADLDEASLAYLGWMVLEEALEMLGTALYLYALLRLVEMRRHELRVTVGS